jgi:hypothetical protein
MAYRVWCDGFRKTWVKSTHLIATDADTVQPESPAASGADMVHAQAVFAIIGALALEKGSAVANQVAKERVLEPLGMFGERWHTSSDTLYNQYTAGTKFDMSGTSDTA